ncbi:MAG: protein O-mannosyl-transferase family, partial [Anaerolineae bacterium]
MILRAGGWRSVVLGLGLGLFVSRTFAEFAGFPGPSPQPLLLLPVLAGLGVLLTALASRRNFNLAPLAVLWVYVLFPRIEPGVAAGAAFVGLVAILHKSLAGRSPAARWGELLLFTLAFSLYLHTLAPTVLPADGGEFQLVAAVLGIAHPPGYPLYTLLGKLFTLVPFAEVATRLNLLSAAAASLTLVLVARFVRQATGSSVGGWAAAVALGASTTFWAQATTANIRMLTAFFAALMLWLTFTYAHKGRPRDLALLAAAAGLGVGHHGSLIWMLPPVLAFLWWKQPGFFTHPRSWRQPAAALALSFLPLLYIPLRGLTGAPFGSAGITDLPSALDHLLAGGFRGDVLYFATPETLPQRLAILTNALEMQFGGPLLLLALAGGLLLLWQDRPLALLLGGSFGLVAFIGITYRAPQSVEYMLPAYLSLAIAFGYLVGSVARLPGSTLPALASATLLFPAATALADRFPSYQMLARDRSARGYADTIIQSAPPGAKVLANWHWATPLWYLQQVEGKRPDLEIVYVFPEG